MRATLAFLATTALTALPAAAEVPKVVTGTPIVQSLVAQVMGDLGAPAVLMDRGGDAHHYQMRPSQARALNEAALLVWVGPELTPWLDGARASAASGQQDLRLLDVPGTELRSFAPEAEEHGEQAEHEHEHDEADHHEEHDAEAEGEEHHHHHGRDPHAWLNPANAQTWLRAIAAELGQIDPDHAADYAANAEAAAAKLKALDASLSERLLPLADQPFVVGHEAYGYLTAAYGLKPAHAVADGDAAAPGAARLAELREDLQADHVVCAFPEYGHDDKQMKLLIEGTGVRLGGTLDPAGLSLEAGPGLYERTLTRIADTLSDCLSRQN